MFSLTFLSGRMCSPVIYFVSYHLHLFTAVYKVFIPLIALRTYLESVDLAYCFYNNLNLSFVHFINSPSTSFSQSSQGGGHRTLLYGHAILLKHTHSSMVSTFTIKYAATAALCCPVLKAAVLPTDHYILSFVLENMSSQVTDLLSLFSRCSTWAVWLLRAHWQTSWLLMWACKKTPQVALHSIAHYFPRKSI